VNIFSGHDDRLSPTVRVAVVVARYNESITRRLLDGAVATFVAAGLPADRIARLGLAVVPEGRQVFPNLSVLENLELGAFTRARERRAENLAHVFDTFPRLRERQTQLAGTMSGGEQQMLAIGRGLMAEPKLLILDEPSLGLSPLLVEEMFTLIAQLRADGLAVLLVEQNVVQSLAIADRAYVMENGSIRFSGTSAELLASDTLRQAYLGV
jgi:branched-chain amino acid transport system ATP-binding protein